MVTLNRMFLEKLGGTDVTKFVGNAGEMFFDPATGVLRVSDGSTPGGIILGALGSTGYVGSFYDTTTQTNPVANVARAMTFNTEVIGDGVTIVDGSKIKVLHVGRYNIQFSAQLSKSDSNNDSVDIWLRKNGTNLAYTNTRVHVNGNRAKAIASWNWVYDAAVNDYFEIMWSSADVDMTIYAEAGNATIPGIPSVILAVTQV